MSKALVKNINFNLLIMFLRLAVLFIMTPILIRNLGDHNYGIWELTISIIGYMGLLDLGLKSSVTRYIAMHISKKEYNKAALVLKISLIFMAGLGGLGVLICILLSIYYPQLLSESGGNITYYSYFLLIIAVSTFLIFITTAIESTIDGLQKYAYKAKITAPILITVNCFIYNYINDENALFVLAIAGVTTTFLRLTLFIVFLKRHYAYLFKSELAIEKKYVYELLIFGVKSFIQNAAAKIQKTITPFLISFILSPAHIVTYTIVQNLFTHKDNIQANLTQPFLPYFSASLNQIKNDFYCRASKMILAFTLPINIGILMLGEEFLTLWLGGDYGARAYLLLILLCFANIIATIDPLQNRLLSAQNKHGIYAKLLPVMLVIQIILNLLFIDLYGVSGVGITLLCSSMVFPFILLHFRCKSQNMTVLHYFKNSVIPLLFPLILMALTIYVMKSQVYNLGWKELLSILMLSSCIYIIGLYCVALTTIEKRDLQVKIRPYLGK